MLTVENNLDGAFFTPVPTGRYKRYSTDETILHADSIEPKSCL
jgi:hypothetical protein